MSAQNGLFLCTDDTLMFVLFKLAIGNFGERLHDVLGDVFLCNVTVVVYENLQHHHCVLTHFVEHVQD